MYKKQVAVLSIIYICFLGYLLVRLEVFDALQYQVHRKIAQLQYKPSKLDPKPLIQKGVKPSSTPVPSENNVEYIENPSQNIVFVDADYSLILLKPDGSHTVLTEYVYTYSYSQNTQKIAYLVADPNDNGIPVHPKAAYIYDIASESSTLLLEYPFTYIEDGGRANALSGVELSPDGQLVYISSLPSFYIYDTSGNKLNQFSTKVDTDPKEGVFPDAWGVTMLKANSSQTDAFFSYGFYEGAKDQLINLSSGEISDKSYAHYIGGENIIGWLDDAHYIVQESEYDVSGTSLYKVNKNTFEKNLLITIPGYLSYSNFSHGYFTYIERKDNVPLAYRSKLLGYNFATGVIQEIFTFQQPSTGFPGNDSTSIYTVDVSEDGQSAVVITQTSKPKLVVREIYEVNMVDSQSSKKVAEVTVVLDY